jgi:AcrR family transcriptional regulator
MTVRAVAKEVAYQRRPAAERRAQIIAAGLALAEDVGYLSVTRDAVASKAGLGAGTVSYYYGSMDELRDAIVSEAVRLEKVEVVARALADKHPAVSRLKPALKQLAKAHLTR